MLRAMLLAALTAMPAPVHDSGPSAQVAPAAVPIAAAAAARPVAAGAAAAPVVAADAGGAVLLARARWTWPLDPAPAVVRSFHPPPTPWSAGHRGVDLAASPGQPVLAVGAGQVTFAGSVAGRGVVVVTHGALRTSYEPVTGAPPVGTSVLAGTPIGVVATTAGHCTPDTCLHVGLRRADTYLDPLILLSTGPPVLKPLRRAG